MNEILAELGKRKLFDPFVGRKLYSYFFKNGLSKIQVHFRAHHLFYGEMRLEDDINWTAKVDKLMDLNLPVSFDMATFKKKFFEMFRSPERFSYTPLIIVEGVKIK